MPTEMQLRTAFYTALFEYVKHDCSGNNSLAAKRLGINDRRICEARSRQPANYPRPHPGKILRPCVANGSQELSRTAQALLDFRTADARKQPTEDFSFIYAGMQILFSGSSDLLQASVDRQPSSELDVIAATSLVELHISAQHCWCIVNWSGHTLIPEFPPTLVGSSMWESDSDMPEATAPNGCTPLARELLRLADSDEVELSRMLDDLNLVEAKRIDQALPPYATARATMNAHKFHSIAYRAAETFISDANTHPRLKHRPLYKLAVAIYTRIDQKVIDISQSTEHALNTLRNHDPAEGGEHITYAAALMLSLTGNRPVIYLTERATVRMTDEGVTSSRRHEMPRFFAKAATPIHDINTIKTAIPADETVFVDEKNCNVFAVDAPNGQVNLIATHKLSELNGYVQKRLTAIDLPQQTEADEHGPPKPWRRARRLKVEPPDTK